MAMAVHRLSSIVCPMLVFAMLMTFATSTASAQGMQTQEHNILQQEVGTWDAAGKMWAPGESEPMEFSGSETNEMLGGLWLISKFDGKMGDISFTGRGTTGYDPAEKKYVGTWIDSVSPYLTIMKGDYDPATKTLTMTGDMRDAGTRKILATKQTWRYIDDNTRTFEIHTPGEDGKMWKMMEIEYKRRGE
jgi:Protein of unknown function (DUF1579)